MVADAGGKTVGTPFNELIYISTRVSPEATKVHHLTAADLKRAKGDICAVGKLWSVWLKPLISGASTVVLAAHNGFACDFRKSRRA
jgi:hypothetical protein